YGVQGSCVRRWASRSPWLRGVSGPFLLGTQLRCEDLCHGSGQAKAPAMAKGPVSCLPRNVLSERQRRKRISLSCERLRALLPQFDGRREDMASVLEMSVQFLRLASALVPGWEKHAVSCPETWHMWQKDVLQLALASQTPAGAPDPSVGTSSVTMLVFLKPPWPQVSGASPLVIYLLLVTCWFFALEIQGFFMQDTVGRDSGLQGSTAFQVGKADPRLASPTEPPSLVLRSPGLSPSRALRPPMLWSRQPPSPLVSEESQSCLGRAGSPGQGTDKAITLDARWVSQWCVRDPLHAFSQPCPSSAWTHCPGSFCPSHPRCLPGWPRLLARSWSSQTLPRMWLSNVFLETLLSP
uniref:BHLH domain-containing protein n=1 Tax=Monodon monoceros TaxID=40151 RepID=A0A8C6F9T0_MONMO